MTRVIRLGLAMLAASPLLATSVLAQSTRVNESPLLLDVIQLTTNAEFLKAGESYFSPDGSWLIFQAVAKPADGSKPSEHYAMFVAPLEFDGKGMPTGMGTAIEISPPGSANTCGWFHPSEPAVVIFGSTLVPPTSPDKPGFRVGQRKYAWAFPSQMDIVRADISAIFAGGSDRPELETIFTRDGYDAECSISPDGRHLLYSRVDETKSIDRLDVDIWVLDLKTGKHTPVIVARGYDGGPFFSPDGTSICYRSDRNEDDRLQLFLAELAFDDDGAITGVEAEHAITYNDHVNWAPFFHPSGKFLVYATSELGHHNYELMAVQLDPQDDYSMDPARRTHHRVTFADGFDGLPAFSSDGRLLLWTSQRTIDGGVGTSQVWLARINPDADLAAWTGPLTRQQAIAVVGEQLGWAGDPPPEIRVIATPAGKEWIIEVIELGSMQPSTTWRVRPNGTAEAMDLVGN